MLDYLVSQPAMRGMNDNQRLALTQLDGWQQPGKDTRILVHEDYQDNEGKVTLIAFIEMRPRAYVTHGHWERIYTIGILPDGSMHS